MTKSLLKLSFLILYLLCFVKVQASSSALFYCQIGQSSKKLPEDKFRFQIKGNEIHFLPSGFFNPGEIFYINENGLFFLARARLVGGTSMGEIEFSRKFIFWQGGAFQLFRLKSYFQGRLLQILKNSKSQKINILDRILFWKVHFCASLNV